MEMETKQFGMFLIVSICFINTCRQKKYCRGRTVNSIWRNLEGLCCPSRNFESFQKLNESFHFCVLNLLIDSKNIENCSQKILLGKYPSYPGKFKTTKVNFLMNFIRAPRAKQKYLFEAFVFKKQRALLKNSSYLWIRLWCNQRWFKHI
jgi:hypothetical protein